MFNKAHIAHIACALMKSQRTPWWAIKSLAKCRLIARARHFSTANRLTSGAGYQC